jgi:hypothetical protein
MDDGALVLGNVELKDQALILSVNSQARADRGHALLSDVLDGLVGQPLVEIQTLEQCMATRDFAPPPRLNLSPQERRTIIHDGLARHYRGLLDEPNLTHQFQTPDLIHHDREITNSLSPGKTCLTREQFFSIGYIISKSPVAGLSSAGHFD